MTTGTRLVLIHGACNQVVEQALRATGFSPTHQADTTSIWARTPKAEQSKDSNSTDRGASSRDLPVGEAHQLLVNVNEAAQRLGVGRTTIYQLINSGRLESVHIGRAARIPAAALDDFVNQLRAEKPPPATFSYSSPL